MNGFILVFGMALVLAVERRSQQIVPLSVVQLAADSPRPWSGPRPQPYGRAADARPPLWLGAHPQPTAVPWPSAQPAADGPTP